MAQEKFKRPNRIAAEMFPLVEAYQSGIGCRAAFYAAHKLLISALNYWQTKYRKASMTTKALRKEKSVDVWKQFSAFLDEQAPQTLPQSPIGKAFI